MEGNRCWLAIPNEVMNTKLVNLTYEVELQPGEQLTLPDAIAKTLGAGRWLITIAPAPADSVPFPTRSHTAFLNGYTLADDGLYDDYPTG
jgi:hypothetical protein